MRSPRARRPAAAGAHTHTCILYIRTRIGKSSVVGVECVGCVVAIHGGTAARLGTLAERAQPHVRGAGDTGAMSRGCRRRAGQERSGATRGLTHAVNNQGLEPWATGVVGGRLALAQ
eukprot:3210771-Prymnesium_polylepis.2